MTAAIIIVLHLKMSVHLPVPAASLHFGQCDVCGTLRWVWHRLKVIYQSDLIHHGLRIIVDTSQGI